MENTETDSLQLVYDEECPLCNWYTGKFIDFHFLDENGRIPWTKAADNVSLTFNRELSRNKIALLKNGVAVRYGLDSLLEVLSVKHPWIAKIGFWRPIHFLLLGMYDFVSYNRKVVAPTSCEGSCHCIPDDRLSWRIAYIVFAGLVVNLATGMYFTKELAPYFIGHPIWTDAGLFAAQFGFQFLIFRSVSKGKFAGYAGNLATVSLIGAFLLLFFHTGLTMFRAVGIHTELLAPFCYGMVYLHMFLEHKKRVKLLGLSQWLGVSWMVFRIFIYPLAFRL